MLLRRVDTTNPVDPTGEEVGGQVKATLDRRPTPPCDPPELLNCSRFPTRRRSR
jgi:hypothetical protein